MSRDQRATPRNSRSVSPGSASRLAQVHRDIALSSLRRMLSTPGSSLMTTFVIAVSLLLPALLFGLNSNLSAVLREFQDNARITLYLEEGVTNSRGLEVSETLLTGTDISTAVYISADQALSDFSAAVGLENLTQELTTNPLPAAIVLTPNNAAPAAVAALAERLQAIPEVSLIQVDSVWLQRLEAISSLIDVIGRALMAIVVLGLFFIVGNTIKLAIENRKDEIRVIKLVGGTDIFIARPFLYAGLYFGLAGGMLACLLQAIVLIAFNFSLRELIQLYESSFELRGFDIGNALLLILLGAAIGWTAALLASLRHIRAINPRFAQKIALQTLKIRQSTQYLPWINSF